MTNEHEAIIKPYYPEKTVVTRIMSIEEFLDIRDRCPNVLRNIDFELIVVDSGIFKPFKYYRYKPKTDELEEIIFE